MTPQHHRRHLPRHDVERRPGHRPGIISAVTGDANAMKYVKGFGLQWNLLPSVSSLKSKNLPIVQSEHKCGNYPWNPAGLPPSTRAAGQRLCLRRRELGVHPQLDQGGRDVYSAWNMVLDTAGKNIDWMRHWPQNALLLVTSSKTLTVTPAYYVFRHVSQYVDPGAKVVGTSGGDALAFKNPDGTIVAVVYNSGAAKTMTVAIGGKKQRSRCPATAGRRSTGSSAPAGAAERQGIWTRRRFADRHGRMRGAAWVLAIAAVGGVAVGLLVHRWRGAVNRRFEGELAAALDRGGAVDLERVQAIGRRLVFGGGGGRAEAAALAFADARLALDYGISTTAEADAVLARFGLPPTVARTTWRRSPPARRRCWPPRKAEWAAAVRTAAAAAAAAPGVPHPLYALGRARALAGDLGGAARALDAATVVSPGFLASRMARAEVLLDLGNAAGARAALTAVLAESAGRHEGAGPDGRGGIRRPAKRANLRRERARDRPRSTPPACRAGGRGAARGPSGQRAQRRGGGRGRAPRRAAPARPCRPVARAARRRRPGGRARHPGPAPRGGRDADARLGRRGGRAGAGAGRRAPLRSPAGGSRDHVARRARGAGGGGVGALGAALGSLGKAGSPARVPDADLDRLGRLVPRKGKAPRAMAGDDPMQAYLDGVAAQLAGDLPRAAERFAHALGGHGDACRAAGEYVAALRAQKRRPDPAAFAPLRAENGRCVNLP